MWVQFNGGTPSFQVGCQGFESPHPLFKYEILLIFKKVNKYAKSKKGKITLTVVGKTDDGKLVVQGVFKITTSILGLPLEYVLLILKENNMIVDWIDFYKESVQNKWKSKTLITKIEASIIEIYDKKYCNEVMKRLLFYIDNYGGMV